MRFIGSLLLPIGFVLMFVGAGTSDLEMARALVPDGVQAHLLTGVPLALVGTVVLALGWLIIKANPQR